MLAGMLNCSVRGAGCSIDNCIGKVVRDLVCVCISDGFSTVLTYMLCIALFGAGRRNDRVFVIMCHEFCVSILVAVMAILASMFCVALCRTCGSNYR